MSGRYNGMQALIKNHNHNVDTMCCPLFKFSWSICSGVINNCIIIFCIYTKTFFSTPKRWNVLSSRLKEAGHVVIKRLCGTRWSSHTDAVSGLSDGYSIVLDVIIKIILMRYH